MPTMHRRQHLHISRIRDVAPVTDSMDLDDASDMVRSEPTVGYVHRLLFGGVLLLLAVVGLVAAIAWGQSLAT